MRLLVLPALAASLALGACGGPSGGAAPEPTGPSGTPVPSPSPTGPSRVPVLGASPGAASDAQTAAVEAARQLAARDFGLRPTDLQVEDVQARQWPDRSLGCPRQGVLYAQIVTPGYIVVLAGGGKRLEYHTDDRGFAVFCQER
ncbi:MAG TPA: hypothetical protein VFA49_03470 [Chloroflexota bacterium]|jgi:hypothetical protein|nr:hypothetical protein [Chloroflexota bacterium]